MHTPGLYTVLASTDIELGALSSNFNAGDLAYVQSTALYYRYVDLVAPGPAGSITSVAGGYFEPLATSAPTQHTVRFTVAGGLATLAYASDAKVSDATATKNGVVAGDFFVEFPSLASVSAMQLTPNGAANAAASAPYARTVGGPITTVEILTGTDNPFTLTVWE